MSPGRPRPALRLTDVHFARLVERAAGAGGVTHVCLGSETSVTDAGFATLRAAPALLWVNLQGVTVYKRVSSGRPFGMALGSAYRFQFDPDISLHALSFALADADDLKTVVEQMTRAPHDAHVQRRGALALLATFTMLTDETRCCHTCG